MATDCRIYRFSNRPRSTTVALSKADYLNFECNKKGEVLKRLPQKKHLVSCDQILALQLDKNLFYCLMKNICAARCW